MSNRRSDLRFPHLLAVQAKKDLEEKTGTEFPALTVSAEETAAVFEILDKDGSGSIKYAEFVALAGAK